MGHDLTFVRLSSPTHWRFPVDLHATPRLPGLVFAADPEERCRLGQILGRFPRARPKGPDGWSWEEEGGGSLAFWAGRQGAVSLDVCASWEAVLELYRHVRKYYPDMVILDDQEGCLYDESSFVRLKVRTASS